MRPLFMRPKGFTLIELLLTLSLFSGVMALLTSGYFQFYLAEERLNQEVDLAQEARAIEILMTEDLRQVRFLKKFVQDRESTRPLSGIDSISERRGDQYISTLNLHVEGDSRFFRGLGPGLDPGLHEVGYALVEEVGKTALFRREEFYLDEDLQNGENNQSQLLSDRVRSLRFEWLISEGEPQDRWTSTPEKPFPKAVTVSFLLEDEKGHQLQKSFTVNFYPDLGEGVEWGM